MTNPVGPVGPAGRPGVAPAVPDARDDREPDRRAKNRRQLDRRKSRTEGDKETTGRELVPVGDRISHDPTPPQKPSHPASAEAAFAAQLMGQTGQKRGLRGGTPVLDTARSTYLGAEYTGEKERRPPVGKTRKTEI